MNKRLYKSNDKMLCGVCGGIAEYFNIDPTLVRLGLVVFSLAGDILCKTLQCVFNTLVFTLIILMHYHQAN